MRKNKMSFLGLKLCMNVVNYVDKTVASFSVLPVVFGVDILEEYEVRRQ